MFNRYMRSDTDSDIDNQPTANQAEEPAKFGRRKVPADLIEATPSAGGLAYWVLASPLILFLAWLWIDLFAHFSPLTWYWLNALLGMAAFVLIIILPLGYAAHWCVTSVPGLFQHAGWDVQPLDPVSLSEQYTVRYIYKNRHRAASGWARLWMRAAQGWVYLEIGAIFAGAVAMIPLFMSASDFGFGK